MKKRYIGFPTLEIYYTHLCRMLLIDSHDVRRVSSQAGAVSLAEATSLATTHRAEWDPSSGQQYMALL